MSIEVDIYLISDMKQDKSKIRKQTPTVEEFEYTYYGKFESKMRDEDEFSFSFESEPENS